MIRWTRTILGNPSVMFSSITHNCIPAIVCSQHTQLVNMNRLCCYRSSHTFSIRDMFAAYHTHLVKLNRLCSLLLNANSSSEWTICRISHTPSSGWPFLLCCLITNSSSEWTICCTWHTPWSGCPFLLFLLMKTVNWTEPYALHRTRN